MKKLMNNFLDRVIGFVRSKRGGNEIIGFVLLLIFIMLAVAPTIKDLGNTTNDGIADLNTSLEQTLTE